MNSERYTYTLLVSNEICINKARECRRCKVSDGTDWHSGSDCCKPTFGNKQQIVSFKVLMVLSYECFNIVYYILEFCGSKSRLLSYSGPHVPAIFT
jgi:hypothetical protein